METLSALFSEQSFMPHGHCYLWTPSMLWLQVLTNAIIGLSYVAISATLVGFMQRVEELPLRFLYVAFGVFIIACGITHFMDVWVIWEPRYWLDGSIRALTAVASLGTAFVLPRFVPVAVTLLQGAQRMRREGVALEKAMADLANMYQRTRELDQLKTDFFANVSHELRTPLTLILAPVDNLMRRTDVSPEALEQLHMVRRNAAHLLQHVNDLLDVQKLDAGKLAPKYTEIDMAQLVRGTSAQFDSLLRERNITLTMVLPEQLLAQVDEEKMHRVCLNLLSNALKFTPDGGTIRVRVWGQKDGLHIEVRDTGVGMPADQVPYIFDKFYQVGQHARTAGAGLGLAIAREIVEEHGGTISCDSQQNRGTTFRIALPTDRRTAPRAEDEAVEKTA